ncbi:uncharacterized protein LOC131940071 [Physella acuta]|uniref:uncharacterized protein LOC131940071 n=1 Tax=Physella acuta TaxID=109671 RepID=UPI0027DB6C10|nr:uncharacterized protein LOC131940071 [Physella acuta]
MIVLSIVICLVHTSTALAEHNHVNRRLHNDDLEPQDEPEGEPDEESSTFGVEIALYSCLIILASVGIFCTFRKPKPPPPQERRVSKEPTPEQSNAGTIPNLEAMDEAQKTEGSVVGDDKKSKSGSGNSGNSGNTAVSAPSGASTISKISRVDEEPSDSASYVSDTSSVSQASRPTKASS